MIEIFQKGNLHVKVYGSQAEQLIGVEIDGTPGGVESLSAEHAYILAMNLLAWVRKVSTERQLRPRPPNPL